MSYHPYAKGCDCARCTRHRRKPKTIKFAELKRLSLCNSPKLPSVVNALGRRMEWVGIGWIDAGKATGREVKVVD